MTRICALMFVLMLVGVGSEAQEMHDHPAPEKLGRVSFPITCASTVQAEFNRGVALLHSFAYGPAREAFQKVASDDPSCAIAHWGVAMAGFHQLWEPPLPAATMALAQQEIGAAERLGSGSARERSYIHALSVLLTDVEPTSFAAHNLRYEQAMADLAAGNKQDVEAQVFYALALLSNASPADKTHARQKRALAILEPLAQAYPDHPGMTHYIIHACDSTELARHGETAARAYAGIAPDAPHALHMPSHIFTRLGLWDESIASNLAARKAAHEQGDVGEELHAMDYLVYAYLQLGRDEDVDRELQGLRRMKNLHAGDFKVGYASTAMPVRSAIERQDWAAAARVEPAPGSPPHVAAIAVWAKALGKARGAVPSDVESEISLLAGEQGELSRAGNAYWAAQTEVLRTEVVAWAAQAHGNTQEAEVRMRAAADGEDAMEKLPVTPGPIVPAREQLGELLILQNRRQEAAEAFRAVLVDAPGRKGALAGLARATR